MNKMWRRKQKARAKARKAARRQREQPRAVRKIGGHQHLSYGDWPEMGTS